MINRLFIIDPGKYWIRAFNHNGQKFCKERGCFLETEEHFYLGKEAIFESWNHLNCKLRHFIGADGIAYDPECILEKVLMEIEQDRALFKPSALVLYNERPSRKDRKRWQDLSRSLGFGKIAFQDILLCGGQDFQLRVHAGHSVTRIGICAHGKVLSSKTIPFAGEMMDHNIVETIAKNYKTIISTEDAAQLKEIAGKNFFMLKNPMLSCLGLDCKYSYERIELPALELWPSIKDVESQIALWAKNVLASSSMDVLSKASQLPIRLSGGLKECFGLKEALESELQMEVEIADENFPEVNRGEIEFYPL